ncbi:MAG: phosphatase [Lachnospiraceae bacterium]|nr:phosphatase [Lachnospiraceae bacterium]
MNITIDTHTHTLASGHAYSTIREMAEAAKRRNLQMLAITDHAPSLPGAFHEFYFHNLRVIPRDYYGIPILFGVELNIMNTLGEIDMPQPLLKQMDIIIASIHGPCFGEGFDKITFTNKNYTMKDYTNAYVGAMKNPNIHIIGHPDDSRYLPDYEVLVRTAKETGTLLEVNNSSLAPTSFREHTRENILTMLDLCKQYETVVTTGSDAHVESAVGNFDNIKDVFAYCNFPEELVITTDVKKLKAFLG